MVGGFVMGYLVKDGSSDDLAPFRMAVAFERAGADFERLGEFLFPEIIPVLEGAVADQFLAEGKGPHRGKWASLSPKYAAAKRKKHGVRPILLATGAMMSALTNEADPHAQRVYNTKQLTFGTSEVPYASYHQTGTTKMTDRPVLDFDEGDMNTKLERVSRKVARNVARGQLDKFVTVANSESNALFDSALTRSF